MKYSLRLTFESGRGESYTMAIQLSEDVASDIERISPLSDVPSLHTFEEAADVIRRREFRSELFQRECRRLGALLAERMQDAEGWHDLSRVENAQRQLKDFTFKQ